MNRVEVLVADIGSTLTKLSAFAGVRGGRGSQTGVRFLGQAAAVTTVAEGDVTLGLEAARRDLETRFRLGTEDAVLMAAASAAGGLRMTVHGLTQDMTLRAAREASLGAGAIVIFTTAGVLSEDDLDTIRRRQPNVILLAGGVDYGDRDVVVANARMLVRLGPTIPVIYAGNRAARGEVERILRTASKPVFLVDNVYPRIDEFNIDPVRKRIQEVFSEHIVTAPGMAKLKPGITGRIVPTPAAVMGATELLAQELGDVLTVDVGGATTDVHSVTDGSPDHEHERVAPEPRCKRTVEGDLGVYINAARVVAAAGQPDLDIRNLTPIPDSDRGHRIAVELTRWAVDIAIWRHAGERRPLYGVYGHTEIIEGKDLTAIEYLVGTGGALTRLAQGRTILRNRKDDPRKRKLLPPDTARVLLDRHYIMAAAGVLSQHYPRQARQLLRQSLGLAEYGQADG